MKIELKNIKYAAFASEETSCFEASVYVDGKRRGTVRNDGHGGCDFYEPWSLQAEIEAYAKTLPPMADKDLGSLPMSSDLLIGQLLDAWLVERDLRKKCSRSVLFRKPDFSYGEGEYHTLKAKYSPQAKAFLLQKYGEKVEIINERFA